MTEQGTVEYRIGTVTMIFMLGFAIVADLLQVLLTLTVFLALGAYLVTFFAEAVLFLWFLILGVNYFSGKKAGRNIAAMGISVITELIPVIDALPAITIAVAFIIWNSRAEDREKFSGKANLVIPKNLQR